MVSMDSLCLPQQQRGATAALPMRRSALARAQQQGGGQ